MAACEIPGSRHGYEVEPTLFRISRPSSCYLEPMLLVPRTSVIPPLVMLSCSGKNVFFFRFFALMLGEKKNLLRKKIGSISRQFTSFWRYLCREHSVAFVCHNLGL